MEVFWWRFYNSVYRVSSPWKWSLLYSKYCMIDFIRMIMPMTCNEDINDKSDAKPLRILRIFSVGISFEIWYRIL